LREHRCRRQRRCVGEKGNAVTGCILLSDFKKRKKNTGLTFPQEYRNVDESLDMMAFGGGRGRGGGGKGGVGKGDLTSETERKVIWSVPGGNGSNKKEGKSAGKTYKDSDYPTRTRETNKTGEKENRVKSYSREFFKKCVKKQRKRGGKLPSLKTLAQKGKYKPKTVYFRKEWGEKGKQFPKKKPSSHQNTSSRIQRVH